MKEQDLNVVRNLAQITIETYYPDIAEAFGSACAPLLITNVYMMNDITTGLGQDVTLPGMVDKKGKPLKASLISNPDSIYVILPEGASHYRADLPLCGYENLGEDITNICMITQAVLDRIDANVNG